MLVAAPRFSHEGLDDKKVMAKRGGISATESAILNKFFGTSSPEMEVVEKPAPPPVKAAKKKKRPARKSEKTVRKVKLAPPPEKSHVEYCTEVIVIDSEIPGYRHFPSAGFSYQEPPRKRSALQKVPALDAPVPYQQTVDVIEGFGVPRTSAHAIRLPPLSLPPLSLSSSEMSSPIYHNPYEESSWMCTSAWPEPDNVSRYEEVVSTKESTKRPLKNVVNTHDSNPKDPRLKTRQPAGTRSLDPVYATIEDVSVEDAAKIRESASSSAPFFEFPDVSKPPPSIVGRTNFNSSLDVSSVFPSGRIVKASNAPKLTTVRNPYPPAVKSPADPTVFPALQYQKCNNSSRYNHPAGCEKKGQPADSDGSTYIPLTDSDIPENLDQMLQWDYAPLPELTYSDCEFLT